MSRLHAALLLLLALLGLALAASRVNDGYSVVPQNVGNFQADDGGFNMVAASSPGDLDQTQSATFLAALNGLEHLMSPTGVLQFLQDLQNKDGGYAGEIGGYASDVISTRRAVQTYLNLGAEVPDVDSIVAYVLSLWDEAGTKLFAPTAGRPGNVEGTESALITLGLLGRLEDAAAHFEAINLHLGRNAVAEGPASLFSFTAEPHLPPLVGACLGINIGKATGYDFAPVEAWAAYVAGMQTPEGGFAPAPGSEASLAASSLAVLALRQLDSLSAINSQAALNAFARSRTPRQLTQTAYAHMITLGIGSALADFQVQPGVENDVGLFIPGGIVQGTSFRPVIRVRGPSGNFHPALAVDAVVTLPGQPANTQTFQLHFVADRNTFMGRDVIDTTGLLGTATIAYRVRRPLALNLLKLDTTVTKSIGFGINVVAQATNDVTGKDIRKGEEVSPGTEFAFDVELTGGDGQPLAADADDYVVSLEVRDSSGVVVASDKHTGAEEAATHFDWTLSATNLPPGQLSFVFAVSNADGPHTQAVVSYLLNAPMVATAITFEGTPSYKLGDSFSVSMTPAMLPDLATVTPLQPSKLRAYWLDVRSASGALLQSVPGVAADSGNAYSFSVNLPASLDYIGDNTISFRYQPAAAAAAAAAASARQQGFLLQRYDEAGINEEPLGFAINADLRVTDVTESPDQTELSYGDTIGFRFKVVDQVTGSAIVDSERSGVYLVLQHQGHTSATQRAQPVGDLLAVQWAITPNARAGAGVLSIVAKSGEESEETQVTLTDEAGEPFTFEVNIGGEIDVDSTVSSTTNPDAKKTAIVAQFRLLCDGNELRDALLVGSVVGPNGDVIASELPVARRGALYHLTLVAEHDDVPEGSYSLEFYRETDRAQQEGEEAEPLFTIEHKHDGITRTSSAHSLLMVVLLAAYVLLAYKRRNYTKTKSL